MQVFVTTHSTNFVDFLAFQNIYLISRGADRKTECKRLSAGEAPLTLQEELGLRLSTVFMYDRLVFVEGPSDELVLRELARSLRIDLTRANVGFVHMRGIRNFVHYAAAETLEVLARRQVKMFFIVDRDEMTEAEATQMRERLQGRATLCVLQRRELENYLLVPEAIHSMLIDKLAEQGRRAESLSAEAVRRVLTDTAESLKDELIRLTTERTALRPVFLHTRTNNGDAAARVQAGISDLTARLNELPDLTARVQAEVEGSWARRALEIVPGSLVLDGCARHYGVRYRKEAGDGARLARLLGDQISAEIQHFLEDIAGASAGRR